MIVKRSLFFWVLLTCALCLLPSGWLTGLEGALLPGTRGQTSTALFWRAAKEPLAHGLLMFGVAFSLMRLLSAHLSSRPAIGGVTPGLGAGEDEGRTEPPSAVAVTEPSRNLPPSGIKGSSFLNSRQGRASLTLFGVLLIAVLIEGAQALLPASFSRGPAWGDLGASLVGGFIGSLAAILIPIRQSVIDE